MRIHLASDHAGFDLKNHLAAHLAGGGHEVVDHGALTYDPLDDYPAMCIACAQGVVDDPGSLGVVIGGSGNGEQIAANKVDGVRAALVWNPEVARLARQHNDANVMGVGARMHERDEVVAMVEAFIGEDFSGDERHARRIDQLREYECARASACDNGEGDRA